jgi:acetolactate synthase-1/2/3 large subunit
MKLTDYLAQFLAARGVTHAFGMSGGAAVHMFDSISRHPGMAVISVTHEQAAAMAADGYARSTGRIGVAVTTSGPGATNLLTGVCCSFYDSIPTLMLTGQVATHRLRGDRAVRQLGFQETDVVSIFKPVTKYASQLRNPADIRYELELACFEAESGRPGPVLLDIPDDLQRAEVTPDELRGFTPPSVEIDPALAEGIANLLTGLKTAIRPLVILGGGLKTPFVGEDNMAVLDRLGVPALVSWAALDLLPAGHPMRVGTFGVYGPRAGNFAVQNADFIITLGTRLSQNLTGGILTAFARDARITMVDVDAAEMDKFDGRGIAIHHRIRARAADFLSALGRVLPTPDAALGLARPEWLARIDHWKKTFQPDPSPRLPAASASLDAGEVVAALSIALPEQAHVFVDTGGNLTWTCNAFRPKKGQRLFSAWNNTPMGYALPAAMGSAFSRPGRPVIAVIGDGGLMICLAEIATLARHRLPVKIFLFNNHCHSIQKQTLETWLQGRYVGVDPASGLAFPDDFARVAEALGIAAHTMSRDTDLSAVLPALLASPEPVLINFEINPDEKLYPYLKFGAPLENQSPPLDPDQLAREMIVAPNRPAVDPLTQRQSAQGW